MVKNDVNNWTDKSQFTIELSSHKNSIDCMLQIDIQIHEVRLIVGHTAKV